jgi:hypothetical protein
MDRIGRRQLGDGHLGELGIDHRHPAGHGRHADDAELGEVRDEERSRARWTELQSQTRILSWIGVVRGVGIGRILREVAQAHVDWIGDVERRGPADSDVCEHHVCAHELRDRHGEPERWALEEDDAAGAGVEDHPEVGQGERERVESGVRCRASRRTQDHVYLGQTDGRGQNALNVIRLSRAGRKDPHCADRTQGPKAATSVLDPCLCRHALPCFPPTIA